MLKLIIAIIFAIAISIDFIYLGLILPLFAIDEIYDINRCLIDKKEFVQCLFQWQVFVWKEMKDTVNIVGKIILEILITIVVFPYNIICLVVLGIEEMIRIVIQIFIKIFGKK